MVKSVFKLFLCSLTLTAALVVGPVMMNMDSSTVQAGCGESQALAFLKKARAAFFDKYNNMDTMHNFEVIEVLWNFGEITDTQRKNLIKGLESGFGKGKADIPSVVFTDD